MVCWRAPGPTAVAAPPARLDAVSSRLSVVGIGENWERKRGEREGRGKVKSKVVLVGPTMSGLRRGTHMFLV